MTNDLTNDLTSDRTNGVRAPATAPSGHHDAVRSTRLLQAWSLAMVAFGVAIAAVPWVRTDLFSWVARGDTGLTVGFSDDARDYLAFTQTLMGALTAGLGLAAFWLARVPIARREAWGWNAFASSIGLWFVIDNFASVTTGFPRNVVLNVLLVTPLVPALWTTRRRR